MVALAPEHLWCLSQPLDRRRTRIRYGAALAPEVLAASGDPDGLSQPGPLSWLEWENHQFTQYLVRTLSAQG